MESNQSNNLDLDFKLNLGLVVFGRFSDLQKLKEWRVDLSKALVDSEIDRLEHSDVGGHSAAAGAVLPPPGKIGLQKYDINHLMNDLNSVIEKSLMDDLDEKEK